MASKEAQEEGPVVKKLRSSEPDLCVIVGQDEEKKEYRYHSQVLASHSNYIDTMLANPMKKSESMQLSFPDLTPGTWEAMIAFLTDSVKARGMTMEDAMKVAEGYDKYECPVGLQLCDRVFTDIFNANSDLVDRERPRNDLDSLIEAYFLSHQFQLENAKSAGKMYFRRVLHHFGRFGRRIFTQSQIAKLVPLILKDNLLPVDHYEKEEILSPLFPQLIVSKSIQSHLESQLGRAILRLKLSGAHNIGANGFFTGHGCSWVSRRSLHLDGVDLYINIGRLETEFDWVIYGLTEPEVNENGNPVFSSPIVLWKSPYSENLSFPPESGWEPVHHLAGGNPRIEYIYENITRL